MELDIIVETDKPAPALPLASVFQIPAATPLELYGRLSTFLKTWKVLDEPPFEVESRAQLLEGLDSHFAPWMDEKAFGMLVRTLAGKETLEELLASRNMLQPALEKVPALCMVLMVASLQFRFFVARTDLFFLYKSFSNAKTGKIEGFDLSNEVYLIVAHCSAPNAAAAAKLIAQVEGTSAVSTKQVDTWLAEISRYGTEELYLAVLKLRPEFLKLDIKQHALLAAEQGNLPICQFFARIAAAALGAQTSPYQFCAQASVTKEQCEGLDAEIATKAVIYNQKSLLVDYIPVMANESIQNLFWVTVQENKAQLAFLVAPVLYTKKLRIVQCDELIRTALVKDRYQILEALHTANPRQFTHRTLYLIAEKIKNDFYPIPELPVCASLLPLNMMTDYISTHGLDRALRHELDRLQPGAATRLRMRAGEGQVYAALAEILNSDSAVYEPMPLGTMRSHSRGYKRPLIYVAISVSAVFLIGIFALLVRKAYQ